MACKWFLGGKDWETAVNSNDDFHLRLHLYFQEHMEKASQVLTQSVATIDKYRRKTGLGESLGKMVRRPVSFFVITRRYR
jgi:hypothetical protein